MNSRTCNNCGWVHFAVTRNYAENEVARFHEYFDSLTEEQRDEFYGGLKANILLYERCQLCGGPHTDFRESKPGDCPDGCTMGPIIYEESESRCPKCDGLVVPCPICPLREERKREEKLNARKVMQVRQIVRRLVNSVFKRGVK